MRARYDFSRAKRNPLAKLLKRQVTIRLETATIDYFRALSTELGMPYQTLINLYLRDCALSGRKPQLEWKAAAESRAKPTKRSRAAKPVAARSS